MVQESWNSPRVIGREDNEHSDVGFVEISTTFPTQDDFFH